MIVVVAAMMEMTMVHASREDDEGGVDDANDDIREFGEDPSRPKIEKKCILFSSIFNVDRPFQRYLLKTS